MTVPLNWGAAGLAVAYPRMPDHKGLFRAGSYVGQAGAPEAARHADSGLRCAVLKKVLLFVALPVAVAASPLALYSAAGWWTKLTAAISSSNTTQAKVPIMPQPAKSPNLTSASATEGPLAATKPDSASPESIPVADLREVLRFDVTPGWIMRRWPRVSAGLSQLQLQGYRVPLVTGTAEDDLAGALTYYFNPRQEVERITFQGTTGDPRRLVELLVSSHGFVRRLVNEPGSLVCEAPGSDGQCRGELWVRPSRVIRADATSERFQVTLVLNRPEPR